MVLSQYRNFVIDMSAKFSIWNSDTRELKKNHQAVSQKNHSALYKQMSHHIGWDGFVATFCTGVLMLTGCLCWLDKENTVGAYFTPVPVCQAVCDKGFSSKHNRVWYTVCFQLFCFVYPGRGSKIQFDYFIYFHSYKPIPKSTKGTASNIMQRCLSTNRFLSRQLWCRLLCLSLWTSWTTHVHVYNYKL